MKKEEIRKNQRHTQQRLVAWLVLVIVLQILTALIHWNFLQYVTWLAVIYCVILIILWCYLEWQLLCL